MTNAPYKRVIVILADGMRADIFDEELLAGNLPNISRHIVERGSVLHAVTSFPSTTGPAYLPYLTGCYPGTCNVPGIRWFDKDIYDGPYSFHKYRSYVGFESFCMARDMRPHIKTIFELIPHSYSIFNPITRGAGFRRNLTSWMRIWYWYYGHQTDHWGFIDEAAMDKLCASLRKDPSFVFTVFPAIDEYSHLAHPRHPRVLEQYKNLDAAVSKLIRALHIRDEVDDTAIFILSDHGLSATHEHFCLNSFLEKRRLPPFFYPLIFDRKGKLSSSMVSGNGMAHLYFRNANGWKGQTTYEMLEKISPGIVADLLAQPAIDIVACRSKKGAEIFSKRGRAKVSLDGDEVLYEVFGSDPFGYGQLPSRMSAGEELELTLASEYPDAPFQIAHLLTSPRAGDVVVSATPGFDLRLKYEDPEHHGSHGSLHESHMRVPVVSSVKFYPRPMRTVDCFPTFFDLLGLTPPDYIDGTSLSRASV